MGIAATQDEHYHDCQQQHQQLSVVFDPVACLFHTLDSLFEKHKLISVKS